MGIHYLKINKIFENEEIVRYEFDSGIPNCADTGVLEIDKKTGNGTILKNMPLDDNNELAGYAYRAILRHWKKGEFPNRTSWAS